MAEDRGHKNTDKSASSERPAHERVEDALDAFLDTGDKDEKAEKARAESVALKERLSRYDAAELAARQAREAAAEAVSDTGAEALEAADIAELSALRLEAKHSRGAGARIDAVRAAANLEIAESGFARAERDYAEQQARVGELALRSELLAFKADVKELEAVSFDLDASRSRMYGIGVEYSRRVKAAEGADGNVSELTEEERGEIKFLEDLFEYTRNRIAFLEQQVARQAANLKEREEALSDEAFAAVQDFIESDRDEYLSYAETARNKRADAADAVLLARKQEAKIVEAVEKAAVEKAKDTDKATSVLQMFSDSRLISKLDEARDLRKHVLESGEAAVESQIEDAADDAGALTAKGIDAAVALDRLAALSGARKDAQDARLKASAAEAVSAAGSVAETVAIGGANALAFGAEASTEVAATAVDLVGDTVGRVIAITDAGAVRKALYISAGAIRAAGQITAGAARFAGEVARGEMRINAKGYGAETKMAADAAAIGATNARDLGAVAGARRGEAERHIAFDRIGHMMTETGESVAHTVVKTLKKVGVPGSDTAFAGAETAEGIVKHGGFEGFGAGKDVAAGALGAVLSGSFIGAESTNDTDSLFSSLGEGTALRAAVEGFIGGVVKGLVSAKQLDAKIESELNLRALDDSKAAVKVQSDYFVAEREDRENGDYSKRAEVSDLYRYGVYFDVSGDREEAERIARQPQLRVRDALESFAPKIAASDSAAIDGSDTSIMDGLMDTDDGDEEIDNYGGAAVGTGDFERRRGWLRSPYGSLLRGVNTRRTTSQDARLKGVSKQLNRINKTVGKKARKSRAKRKRKKNRRAIIVSLIAALLAAVMFFMMFQGIIMLAILGACGSWASLDASNKKKQAALLASSGLCPCGCGCSCGCGTASGGVANLAGYGFTAETGRHGQALNLYMAMLKYIAEKGYDGTEATRMSIPPGFFFERFQREGAIEIFKSNESGRTKWIDPGVTPELLTESTFAGVVNSDKSIFETLAVSKFTTDGGSLNAISHVFPGGYDTEPRHNTDTIDSINIFGALNTTWDTSYTVQCPQEILDVFGVTVPSSIKRGTTGNPLYLPDILWGQIMRGVKDWDVNKNVLPNGLGLDPGLKAVVQSAEAEPYNTALAFGVAWLSGSYARFEGGGTNSTNTVRAPYWNNYSATIFKDVLSGYATLDTLKPFVGRNTGGGDVDAIVSELSGFSPEAADYVRGYLTNYVVTSTIQATIFYGNYLMPIQVAYYIRFFDDWVKDYFPDYGSASGISPVPITNTGVVTDPSDVTADPDADTGADPGDSTANPDDVTADPAVVGPDAPSAVSVTTLEMTSGGGGSCICDASCYCGAGCAAGAGSLSAGGVGTASVGGARLVEIAVAEIAANGGALGGAKYIDGYGSPAVYGYAWCAIFVSWCATQGGFVESGIILKSMSATAFRAAAQSGAHGTWKDRTYVPAPGDLILFDRDGIGEVGLADHIGIVERVDGGKVYTVEGNTSDTVARRSYDIGRSDIDGYVVPAYGLNTASP